MSTDSSPSAPHDQERLDSEWVTLSALREMLRWALHGTGRGTYENALLLGEEICPDLLGPEVSLLRRHHQSVLAAEFRQKAQAKSLIEGKEITAISLVDAEILEYSELLKSAKGKQRTNRLKTRLKALQRAAQDLDLKRHSENQLIFRDAYNVRRELPEIETGQGYKQFLLPDNNVLRVRVFHPDQPEHISGADIVFERHVPRCERASIVGVQYKLWDDKVLYLDDERLQGQLSKLNAFFCQAGICTKGDLDHNFRFPFCGGFLRPTDRLQTPNQDLRSTGEHLPVCQINSVHSRGTRGARVLDYKAIREMSLSQDVFEGLFSTGKIGSRTLTYAELRSLYAQFGAMIDQDHIVIHAQDFMDVELQMPLFQEEQQRDQIELRELGQ